MDGLNLTNLLQFFGWNLYPSENIGKRDEYVLYNNG